MPMCSRNGRELLVGCQIEVVEKLEIQNDGRYREEMRDKIEVEKGCKGVVYQLGNQDEVLVMFDGYFFYRQIYPQTFRKVEVIGVVEIPELSVGDRVEVLRDFHYKKSKKRDYLKKNQRLILK